ncbi:hypothetical protein PRIPAC_91371 [Pristionchus pacificus]|uniref:F-box domain-containing protein n=1 Tax=Pristionchus pacificus TaxID=54126 RepID=A0A2A6B6V4_PRIPA|nr:hypothetical protein PRIPAC_91371 [Pristionchus pacificus]|eukprot:PDM61620.1 F-box domain-containing protein [Pristionchus pacificus]
MTSPPAKRCRRNRDNTFSRPPTIGDPDLFSKLPDDCLLEIFAYLEHPDLDAVSCVSQRLRPLSIRIRPKVRSGTVDKIRITRVGGNCSIKDNTSKIITRIQCRKHFQEHETKYSLSMFFSPQWITTKTFSHEEGLHADCEYCNGLQQQFDNDPSIAVLHPLFDSIPKAFNFETVEFDEVILGDLLIALCKKYFDVPCKRRVFSNPEIDPTMDRGGIRRYNYYSRIHEWMAVGCSEELEVLSDDLAPLEPTGIVRSVNGTLSSLRIISTQTPKQFDSYARSLPGSLSNCARIANLELDFLEISGAYSFSYILERYRLHLPGSWRFLADAAPVITGIFSPLGLIISKRNDCALELCLNGHKEITVKISPLDIDPSVFSVEATFH